MLRGYLPTTDLKNPESYITGSGPNRGKATRFPLSGDPLRRTGDLDNTGDNLQPGDRRIGLCSGPFSMAPGETQEIVVAVVGGIIAGEGGNNVNSVEQMKLNDRTAQFMYDNLFIATPKPPDKPEVTVTEFEDAIVLEWGSDTAAVAKTEAKDDILGFSFEGYNVYRTSVRHGNQGTSPFN